MNNVPLTGKRDADLIILSNLDDRSLLNFCRASKLNTYSSKLCDNENFWRNRFLSKYNEQEITQGRRWKNFYLSLLSYEGYEFINGIEKALEKKDLDAIKYYLKEFNVPIETVYHLSLEKGAFDITKYLLTLDIDVNMFNRDGLYYASLYGNQDMVEFFLKRGERDFNVGLKGASLGGHQDLVNFFIQRGNFGVRDFDDALIMAAKGGHKDLVEFFILKGGRDFNGAMAAAIEENRVNIVPYLLIQRADLDQALGYAAYFGRRNIIDFLFNWATQFGKRLDIEFAIERAEDGDEDEIANYLRRFK